jgi:hypothetical protein
MTTAANRNSRLTPRQQQQFVAMLPAIQRAAARRFRKTPYDERCELIAEVVALAFAMYVRLIERGKCDLAYATPLAAYGCRQVVVGRRLGSPLNVNDVTSPSCRRRKGVSVQSLTPRDRRTGEWREILVEDRRSTPADIAAARIDFPAFFRSLSRRDRRIALKLANGESTTRVATLFKLSMARISQLRRELCDAWHRFHGEEPQTAAGTA